VLADKEVLRLFSKIMDEKSDRIKTAIICLILAAATVGVYYQVYSFSFVNYDDAEYVYQNPHIRNGITAESLKWALTTGYACFWHPLTWLSHMLDWELYGSNPAGHHITALIFHILNSILIFIVFKQMTGAVWPSAFAAGLFALHPLHVESVAWVSERKDVLSTFFWILAMWGYNRYVRKPKISSYLLMLAFFVLGMMAKPMLVTLPFVFLLLDYWPFERLKWNNPQHKVDGLPAVSFKWALAEKIPMFLIAAGLSVVAFIAQKEGRAIPMGENFALPIRLANAPISYLQYIVKMFWPSGLAMFYPHPGKDISYLYTGISVLILLAATILVVLFCKKHKYLFTGWFWYVGTLVPVIGIIQVGNHAMADRYTYITLTGLFIIIAWGVPDLLGRVPHRRIILWICSIAVLIALGICAHFQTRHWKNTIALCEHAMKVTKENYKAHFCITLMLMEQERFEEAIWHCTEALRINPECFEAYNNMGVALCRLGRFDEAIACYRKLLELRPDFAVSHGNLAAIMINQGAYYEALEHCEIALEILNSVEIRKFYGFALMKLGRYDEAENEYRKIVSVLPDDPNALSRLGFVLARKGEFDEAISVSDKALKISPELAEARLNLGFAYIGKNDLEKAVEQYEKGLAIEPNNAIARSELGVAFFKLGEIDKAVESFEQALKIDPENSAAKGNLEFVLAEKQKMQDADGKRDEFFNGGSR